MIMNLTLMSDLILMAVPFLALLAAYLFQIVVSKLPDAERATLERFVQYGVQMAEQIGGTGQQKKELAVKAITQMYERFHLPVPDREAIDTMIESAVFLVNQMVHPGELGKG